MAGYANNDYDGDDTCKTTWVLSPYTTGIEWGTRDGVLFEHKPEPDSLTDQVATYYVGSNREYVRCPGMLLLQCQKCITVTMYNVESTFKLRIARARMMSCRLNESHDVDITDKVPRYYRYLQSCIVGNMVVLVFCDHMLSPNHPELELPFEFHMLIVSIVAIAPQLGDV